VSEAESDYSDAPDLTVMAQRNQQQKVTGRKMPGFCIVLRDFNQYKRETGFHGLSFYLRNLCG